MTYMPLIRFICLSGHIFAFQNTPKSRKSKTWRCSRRTRKHWCPANVIQKGDNEFKRSARQHDHLPYLDYSNDHTYHEAQLASSPTDSEPGASGKCRLITIKFTDPND